MLANTRQMQICELLKKQSAVTTAALAKKFDVSIETIRKDLQFLEKNNELVRVHGGAVPKAIARPYGNLSVRLDDNRVQKTEVCRLAAQTVSEGDVIALDTGSTVIEFIEVLKERLNRVTIVTHSLDVFLRAKGYKEFQIILCGGYFLQEENSFYGSFVWEMLEKIHVNKVYIFPWALSLQNGLCDSQPHLAEVQKKLLMAGNQVYVLADSSKYETSALLKVSDMRTNYIYFSDNALPEEVKAVYRNNNLTIITNETELNAMGEMRNE